MKTMKTTKTKTMKTTTMLLGALVLLVGVGCADDGEELVVSDGSVEGQDEGQSEGQGEGSPEPAGDTGDTGDIGGGDGPLFVSVERGGGFAPVGFDFRSVPASVVYDDGTTFAPGVTTAVFPGPPVLPVFEGSVGDDELRALAQAAADAGLLGGGALDFGDTLIADASTTTITVVVGGEAHVTSVYALDEADATLPGMDSTTSEAKERVAAFVDLVSRTVSEAGGDVYDPQRYRVLALPADQPGGAGVAAEERDWPFPDLPLAERTCTAITGERAEIFEQSLEGTTEATGWRSDSGEVFTLAVRPVLPNEPDCPAGA